VFILYIITLLSVAYLFIAAWIAELGTRAHHAPIVDTPARYGQAFESVSFRSRDGLSLEGWLLPANGAQRIIILLHGRDSTREENLELAYSLVERGFAVFTYDARARGESEGTRSTLGYHERWDALGAVDYLLARGYQAGRIGLMGRSMGGSVAILAAAETNAVAAVVSDSAFADARDLVREQLLPNPALSWLLAPTVLQLASIWLQLDLPATPERAAQQLAPRPLLIIHGTQDISVYPTHAQRLWAATHGYGELWLLEGVSHTEAFYAQPTEYVRRVTEFFARAMR
jgi:fermentation-respiration switch protein FrsA (DUF1100 family)